MPIANIKTFVSARLRSCRQAMAKDGIDAMIVVDPVNVRYLTGFSGDDSILIVTPRSRTIVTDSRFTEQIRQECPKLPMKVRSGPIASAAMEVLQKSGVIRENTAKSKKTLKSTPPHIAIEADAVTVTQYKAFQKEIGRGLKTTSGLIEKLRICKDQFEIDQLKKAIRIAERAAQETIGDITPKISEMRLAAQLNYQMMSRNAQEPSFATIAAFGKHAAQPHAVPGTTRLKQNDTILVDWGACCNGYRSDLTRCWATGKILPAWTDAYQWLLEAQLAAIEAVKPGAVLAQVDQAARNNWPKRLPIFGHGTGHGIGLNVHEGPTISSKADGQLRPGMVITIEPGVYVPGKFGIRIEDDVLVTAQGAKVLSRLPKDLDNAILDI